MFLDRYNVFAYNKLNGIIHKLEAEKMYDVKIKQAMLDKKIWKWIMKNLQGKTPYA